MKRQAKRASAPSAAPRDPFATVAAEVLDECKQLGLSEATRAALKKNLDPVDFWDEVHGTPSLDPDVETGARGTLAAAIFNVRQRRGFKADLAADLDAEQRRQRVWRATGGAGRGKQRAEDKCARQAAIVQFARDHKLDLQRFKSLPSVVKTSWIGDISKALEKKKMKTGDDTIRRDIREISRL